MKNRKPFTARLGGNSFDSMSNNSIKEGDLRFGSWQNTKCSLKFTKASSANSHFLCSYINIVRLKSAWNASRYFISAINTWKVYQCIEIKVAFRRMININNNSSPFNPLSANPTKWSNTLKQFVGKLPTNCLSVFDHFVGLALKGLNIFVLLQKFKI